MENKNLRKTVLWELNKKIQDMQDLISQGWKVNKYRFLPVKLLSSCEKVNELQKALANSQRKEKGYYVNKDKGFYINEIFMKESCIHAYCMAISEQLGKSQYCRPDDDPSFSFSLIPTLPKFKDKPYKQLKPAMKYLERLTHYFELFNEKRECSYILGKDACDMYCNGSVDFEELTRKIETGDIDGEVVTHTFTFYQHMAYMSGLEDVVEWQYHDEIKVKEVDTFMVTTTNDWFRIANLFVGKTSKEAESIAQENKWIINNFETTSRNKKSHRSSFFICKNEEPDISKKIDEIRIFLKKLY